MTSAPGTTASGDPISREVAIVVALTLLGAVLRLWGLNHLGLVHFDEGIYAIAGRWSVSPRGLAAIDPILISYAPPGFPILVGVAYLFLGTSDVAAILVSIVAGTLTIPATSWLARRTFGAGAGAAAAALVALSGFHVAYSRMALTDASFLLCWVLGLIAAQRFLERPGIVSAIALGLSVGLAQLFKYNGWMVGGVVVFAAALGMLVDPRERQRSRVARIWGFGFLAGAFAAAVYWPWFRFVDDHGGYGALLWHHQSYMSGIDSWVFHLRLQVDLACCLSGGPVWNLAGLLASGVGCGLVLAPGVSVKRSWLVAVPFATLLAAARPDLLWWVGIWFFGSDLRHPKQRLLAVAWLCLAVMTPFYHPYSRLWLPLQVVVWVLLSDVVRLMLIADPRPVSLLTVERNGDEAAPALSYRRLCAFGTVFMVMILFSSHPAVYFPGPGNNPGPLGPSDSLKGAVGRALADLPDGTPGLRLLVRPPVTFYLSGRISAQVEPNLEALLQSRDPRLWALVDLAQLRQEGNLDQATERLLERWQRVHEYPTTLNLPTLLDIDPGAARAGRSDAADEPLWLLRPRPAGAAR
jgi:4-amino-4-deoxy-L-arabinose transferase-like glycosyltransferase